MMINKTIQEILNDYPYAIEYFNKFDFNLDDYLELTIGQMLKSFDLDYKEQNGIDETQFIEHLKEYIDLMQLYLEDDDDKQIKLTVLPGTNKQGGAEDFDKIEVTAGEILSIVGPTGSGKSRLLADIEWAANRDTPTKRQILINDEPVSITERFNVGNKLVAQLSQNMNFVMDLSVFEFLDLHATSRLISDKEEVIKKIYDKAIYLAGEPFTMQTPVTSLSGGQSRALMIADTAYLSKSPIILIDEIENAGIDRRKALELLVSNDKIVLMSTHDPILALMADKRITINNGAVVDVITTSKEEKNLLTELERLDSLMQQYRNDLRYGKQLTKKEA